MESTAAPQKLLILDARSYTAAVANRAKGGGCECEGIAVVLVSAASLCLGGLDEEGAARVVERAKQTWLGVRILPLN